MVLLSKEYVNRNQLKHLTKSSPVRKGAAFEAPCSWKASMYGIREVQEGKAQMVSLIYFTDNSPEVGSPQFSTKWGPIICQHVDV